MPNEKNRVTCNYPDCDKPATRALTYFVDAPTMASVDPKQEAFCDQHAEAEMRNLQEAGLFTRTRGDGTKVDCTVNQLTSGPLEDGYGHKQTKYDSLGVRVGMDTNFCEEL